jgi:hypothetical protein
MAKLDTTGLDDLVRQMEKLGQLRGPVVAEMLDTAAEIVKESWKEAAREHGYGAPGSTGRGTGEMIDSIDFPVKGDARALYRDIYPQGSDSKGVSNATKAFVLHYGRSNMAGSYWVDDAEMNATPKAIEACQEIWDRFLQSGGG